MPALGAFAELGARGRRVERVATDAMEGRAAALEFETMMIAPVIPQPEGGECNTHERAIDNDSGGKIEHGLEM